MKRLRRAGWALLAGLAFGPAHAAPAVPPVKVEIVPAQIVRRSFDLRHPPPEMPRLTPPEAGLCNFEFRCSMDSRVEGRATERSPFTARIAATKVITHLTITLWTPTGGPPKLVAHEEAHREICEIYYRPAAALARRLGEQALRTPLTVTGADKQAGMMAALRQVQDGLIAIFTQEISDRCGFAQHRFDAITNHSRNPIVEADAISQAVAEENDHYRSLHPK